MFRSPYEILTAEFQSLGARIKTVFHPTGTRYKGAFQSLGARIKTLPSNSPMAQILSGFNRLELG